MRDKEHLETATTIIAGMFDTFAEMFKLAHGDEFSYAFLYTLWKEALQHHGSVWDINVDKALGSDKMEALKSQNPELYLSMKLKVLENVLAHKGESK